MSANGEQPGWVQRLLGIEQRSRPVAFVAEEKAEVDPELELKLSLQSWVNQPACKDYFLPWLRKQLDAARERRRSLMESHSKQSWALGVEDDLAALLNQFNEWSQGE